MEKTITQENLTQENSSAQQNICLVEAEKYNESILKVIKEHAKDKSIIYVTINKPCTNIKVMLERFFPKEKIIIIDLASKHIIPNHPNCLHLSSKTNLTELSLAITQAVYHLKHTASILVFDSISTLLIFNEEKPVLKFTNFLVNKLRDLNITSYFVVLKSEEENFNKKILPFVDKVIKY